MAETIGSVKVDITGDYSKLQADFDAAVSQAISSGASIAQALETASQQNAEFSVMANEAAAALGVELQASDAATQAMTTLDEGVAKTDATFHQFAEGVGNFIAHPLRVAGDSAREFLLALGPMGTLALGVTTGIAGLAAEATHLVAEFGAASEKTQNLADRLNLTWTRTRELQDMAKIAGVEITSLQRSAVMLAESFDEDSDKGQKTAQTLYDIGVVGTNSGELLTNFLQKLSEIPDNTERIALAHKVLGRASQEIIPLIKNYDELQKSIKETGNTLSEEFAKKLGQADDAADKLDIAWSKFKEHLAATFAPAVMAGLDYLTRLIAGTPQHGLDEQLAEARGELQRLKETAQQTTVIYDQMGTKALVDNSSLIAGKQALVEHLEMLKKVRDDSKSYNDDIARSNADAAEARRFNLEEEKRFAKEMAEWNKMLAEIAKENKPLSGMTEGIALLVAQEHIQEAKLKDLTEATAKYNEANGTALDRLGYLDQRLADAAAHEATLGNDMGPVTREITVQQAVTDRLSNSMEHLAKAAVKVQQEALNVDKIHSTTAAFRDWAKHTVTVGEVYQNLAYNVQHAFDRVGQSFAQALVKGKGFVDAMKSAVSGLAEAILGTLINAIVKMAEQWVISLILGKATASAVDAGMVTGQSGIAGAAAFASVMAALPFPFNVAAAPGVAAAAAATVAATYIPLATFEEGGMVPHDMFAMVHGGEQVFTAEQTKAALRGGSGGDVYNITVNANGVTASLVDEIGNRIVYKIRQAAGNKSKF